MDRLFEIKNTECKGQGVFALTAIPSGTIIVQEDPIMNVPKRGGKRAAYSNVMHAFERLSKEQQSKVLSLHHGHFETRKAPLLMRIFQANVFGDDDAEQLYLLISRFNHSCIPNATLEGGVITADRHIEAGEEVEIDYRVGLSERMTAKQRAVHFQNDYGFKCSCPACEPTEFGRLSDMRRVLINVLSSALEGFQPRDLTLSTCQLVKASDGSYQWVNVPEKTTPLAKKLTIHQFLEYKILLARLREAEGCLPTKTATSYFEAGYAMYSIQKRTMPQHRSTGLVIFLEPLRCIRTWIRRSLEIYAKARGLDSQWVVEGMQQWKELQDNSTLGFLLKMVSQERPSVTQDPNRPIAVLLDTTGPKPLPKRMLSRSQWKELLQRQGKQLR